MPLLCRHLRTASYLWGVTVGLAPVLEAQTSAAEDTARAIARLDGALVESAELLEREVWPGYRYDSLGVLFMIPGKAKLAVRPPADVPTGMRPLSGFDKTWWADTQRVSWSRGLPVANISTRMTRGQILALAMHEAFHAHEQGVARAGRRFGRGENSLLTAQYPVFDLDNESSIAVEGQLLASALHASTVAEARRLGAQFAAVRTRRYASLHPDFIEYERLAELHEGLAQYVYLRGLAVLASTDASLSTDARRELETESRVLQGGGDAGARSVRRRFYATGSHLGFLLDRLTGSDWKQRVVRDDAWLDELLAEHVGTVPVSAATDQRLTDASTVAARTISALGRTRNHLRDSLLQLPGTRIVLHSVQSLDWCGFDPQNLLTTPPGQLLHMRMLALCGSGERIAQFARPVVEDTFTGTWHTVVSGPIRLTSSGKELAMPAAGDASVVDNLELTAPGVTLRAKRAVLIVGRDRVHIVREFGPPQKPSGGKGPPTLSVASIGSHESAGSRFPRCGSSPTQSHTQIQLRRLILHDFGAIRRILPIFPVDARIQPMLSA